MITIVPNVMKNSLMKMNLRGGKMVISEFKPKVKKESTGMSLKNYTGKIRVKNVYTNALRIEGEMCEVGQVVQVEETQGVKNLIGVKWIVEVKN
jgi:hypothetical protein